MAIDDGSLGDWGPSPMTEKESILSNRVRELEKIVSIMRPALEFYAYKWERVPNVGFDTFAKPGEGSPGLKAREALDRTKELE